MKLIVIVLSPSNIYMCVCVYVCIYLPGLIPLAIHLLKRQNRQLFHDLESILHSNLPQDGGVYSLMLMLRSVLITLLMELSRIISLESIESGSGLILKISRDFVRFRPVIEFWHLKFCNRIKIGT